jgi:hypothetical protein
MATGIVKWFNPAKGFGVIQPASGDKAVVAHISPVDALFLSGQAFAQYDTMTTMPNGIGGYITTTTGPNGTTRSTTMPNGIGGYNTTTTSPNGNIGTSTTMPNGNGGWNTTRTGASSTRS